MYLPLPKRVALWLAVLLVLCLPVLTLSGPGTPALAQDEGSENPMEMTPEGAGEDPDEAPEGTDDSPKFGGPNTGLTNDRMEEEADKESDEEQAKENGEAPPTEDCGMTDITCMTNNALIAFVWWIIRAPMLFIQELITGFEGMGFALPEPSGPLMEKYDQVGEKVRPMVLVGMLITGGLMLARSANYNTAYLLQSGLPRIGLAVLGLAFFPQFAKLISDISNGLATSFYEDAEVTKMFASLIKETILAEIAAFLAVLLTPASWGILGIMALVFLGPVLVLILLLFVITYMNGLFFSLLIMTGPIALVCYAVPGLQSVTEVWFKGILASAVLPIIFSIEIMLMSWAGGNPEAIGAAGGTASIVVCVLLLWVMVKTPGKVYHWAFGSVGGGQGGGFLAGMGMRSLLRKGLQIAGGAATGGAGAALAGAAGGAGATGGVAGGAIASGAGRKAIGAAGDQFAKNSHKSWGTGRLLQHGTAHEMRRTMSSLQGEPGAIRAIRQSGQAGLSAQNKIDDLKSQVLGGNLSEEEAEKQAKEIQGQRDQDKQSLAQNLAQNYAEPGMETGDYERLIDAEEDAQLKGQGSQVEALETPHRPGEGANQSVEPQKQSGENPEQPTEADRLQEYTARMAGQEEASTTETTTVQPGEEGRTDRISGDENSTAKTGAQEGSGAQQATPSSSETAGADQRAERTSGGEAVNPNVDVQPQRASGRNALPQVGEAGYSPPRHTQGPMDDVQKAKAEKVNAMLASDPEAARSYKRALDEDKKMRNKQGKAHYDAMRGVKSSSDARQSVADIQKNRDKNLRAAAEDLAKRYHSSPHSPSRGGKNGPPVTEKDVRQILGAKFDYAYDEPQSQSGRQAPSYGSFYQEKVSGSSPDGNFDGPGNGKLTGNNGVSGPGGFSNEPPNHDKAPDLSKEDKRPNWQKPGQE